MANIFSPTLPITGPWYISSDDWMGDSLQYFNANVNYLATLINTLSAQSISQTTIINTLSTQNISQTTLINTLSTNLVALSAYVG
jgi:hypothetical protein